MKKKLLMLLVMAVTLVSFISCDLAAKDDVQADIAVDDGTTEPVTRLDTETIVITPIPAADGFTLTASNVAFNAKSAVSILSAGNFDADFVIYAPTQFDALENGTDPVVTFTFNENLRATVNDAVYSISTDGTTSSQVTGVASKNVFYIGGTPVDAKSVAVSGMTVTFTFDAGTFSVEDLVAVVFGVTSESGEYYKVSTAFQPLADVTTAVTLDADFSDYYSYALDYNKVFFLNKATAETHTTPYEAAQNIAALTATEGSDFGNVVNTFMKRYSNNDLGTPAADFETLEDVTNQTSDIKLVYTDATNATSYVLYYVSGGMRTELLAGSDYTVSGYELTVDISAYNIASDDSFVIVPANSRGEFTNYEASYVLVDNVQPFSTGTINRTIGTTLNWAGVDYTTHVENIADTEGEVIYFGDFDLSSLTGWAASYEAIEYNLVNHNLIADITTGTSAGSVKDITAATVIEAMGLDADATLVSVGNVASSSLWVLQTGTTISIYVGIECKSGVSGLDYSGETWEVTGAVNISAEDLSGNILLYQDQTSTAVETGIFNITIQ